MFSLNEAGLSLRTAALERRNNYKCDASPTYHLEEQGPTLLF